MLLLDRKLISDYRVSEGEYWVIGGFVRSFRNKGKIAFADIHDKSGSIQVVFRDPVDLKKESVVLIKGVLNRRKSPNLNVQLGEWEIESKECIVLSSPNKVLPFELVEAADSSLESTRLKYRYLDIRSGLFKNLEFKSKLLSLFRDSLSKFGFVEINTPSLSISSQEGANTFDVNVIRDNKNAVFSLSQSPQLYKQLLMIGGVERYFQVANCFRREDLRSDRQYEFLQLDMEMSFARQEDLFSIVEESFSRVFNELFDDDVNFSFEKITYEDSWTKYGSDKPDLRHEFIIEDFTLEFSRLVSINKHESAKGIFLPSVGINVFEEKWRDLIKTDNDIFILEIKDGRVSKVNLMKLGMPEGSEILKDIEVNRPDGTLILSTFDWKTKKRTLSTLGNFRINFSRKNRNELSKQFKFAWIIDWPLFEYNEVQGEWVIAHHLFTKPVSEEIGFDKTVEKSYGYDLVLNGSEIASGSVRNNSLDMQRYIFELAGLSEDDVENNFGWFIEAFNYGVPPHLGIALGVDRIVQILLNLPSIRDVIAFPKNNHGICPMTNAPLPESHRREYEFERLEKKWIQEWTRRDEFKFVDNGQENKKYILDMFPYPSGSGLHVGHLKGYLATDILSRMFTMQGYLVFHPMGWDAFGLPAEQYAIKTGNSPETFTKENINNFRNQLKKLMLSYDFNREVDTSDPNYYKHTQWIFSQMYKHGFAELRDVPVNWCYELNTVLSDEEILEDEKGNRVSERGGYPVVQKIMKQWVLKITAFAEELLDDLEDLEWPENIKLIQKNWIGKQTKYFFRFSFTGKDYYLKLKYFSSIRKLVGVGIHMCSELAKQLDLNEFNRASGECLPIKLRCEFSNRDFNVCFLDNVDSRESDLIPIFEGNQTEDDFYNDAVEEQYLYLYRKKVKLQPLYKLRDWVFSRQRFWGEPIPILYEGDFDGSIILDEQLPVVLPHTVDYVSKRDGRSPLVNNESWMSVTRDGNSYLRETNTMPNWAGSSWYFIAYLLKKPDGTYYDLDSPEAKEILKRWLPVDIYVGGQEHAAMHLLYARFWHKFLFKLGIVDCKEPFKCLFNQGLVLGSDGQKMSKSKGNYVSIDEMVDKYGSDALRVYEAFSGPTNLCFTWDEKGIISSHKWLSKVYSFFFGGLEEFEKVTESDIEVSRIENKLIENVSSAIPLMKVNVGVSEMMIFLNGLNEIKKYHIKALTSFVQILSLYAPALAEEIWSSYLKKKTSLFRSTWPVLNDIDVAQKEYKVFLNGKFKFILEISKHEEDEIEHLKTIVSMKFEEQKLPISIEKLDVNTQKRVMIVSGRKKVS